MHIKTLDDVRFPRLWITLGLLIDLTILALLVQFCEAA